MSRHKNSTAYFPKFRQHNTRSAARLATLLRLGLDVGNPVKMKKPSFFVNEKLTL